MQLQKISMPTSRKVTENSEGEGVKKPTFLKERMMQRGGVGVRSHTKNSYMGRVHIRIFSGTPHYNITVAIADNNK